jgi:nucleoside-diphosphate-sugar epimerase
LKFTILGSSGFIGSALSSHLKSQQIECVDLDLRTEEIRDKSLGHVIYAIGEPNFKEKPIQSIDAHVLKLEKFLEKANFESFLYLSSTRIYYGSTSTDEDSSLLVNPLKFDNLYNISKIMGEAICNLSHKQNVRIVRLSNVTGKNFDTNIFLSSIIYDAITNKEIILKTKLDSKRDYILLEDVVKILPKISMFGKSKIYNVAYGKNLKNSEIVEKIKEITGCTYKVEKNAKDYSYQPISIQKIQNEFNFNPTSSILTKLNEIITAFQKNKI